MTAGNCLRLHIGSASANALPPDTSRPGTKSQLSPVIASVLPEIVRRVLEYDVDARFAVAILQQVAHHRAVLLGLLLVAGAGLGDDPRDVAYRGHQLLLDRFLQWLVAAIADLLAAPRGRPQVGDHFLAETVGGRADDRYLLPDRFQEALVRRQLFLGVAVAHLGLVDVSLSVVEIVLEQSLGLLLVGVDEGARDLFLEQFEILLV